MEIIPSCHNASSYRESYDIDLASIPGIPADMLAAAAALR